MNNFFFKMVHYYVNKTESLSICHIFSKLLFCRQFCRQRARRWQHYIIFRMSVYWVEGLYTLWWCSAQCCQFEDLSKCVSEAKSMYLSLDPVDRGSLDSLPLLSGGTHAHQAVHPLQHVGFPVVLVQSYQRLKELLHAFHAGSELERG